MLAFAPRHPAQPLADKDGPFLASALPGRIERVRPCAVISDVDDADDVGKTAPKKTLNALPDGDLGKSASLTSPFEADLDAI